MNRYSLRFLLAFIASALLTSCTNEKEKVEPPKGGETDTIFPQPVQKAFTDITAVHALPHFNNLQNGSTNYVVDLHIEDWLSGAGSVPDYGRMLPKAATLQMIAIGGGMTAGAQNGGLYRQGQLGAYPNLVAKQLGMADFVTPAFGKSEANGTGFFLLTDNASPSFNKVTNNLTTIVPEADGYPPVFGPFDGKVNNFSAPWLSADNMTDATWDPWMVGRISNGMGVSWALALPYLWRFTPQSKYAKSALLSLVKNEQQFNFFLLEHVSETFYNSIRLKSKRNLTMLDLVGDIVSKVPRGLALIASLSEGGKKGVVFTMPQFEDLGFANWGIGVLNDSELVQYRDGVNISNKEVRKWAQEYDLALVDLEALYKAIHRKEYILKNGLLVDGSIRGNFFSSDGLYPTSLGQVIIANEVLKSINEKYEANAPLIDIPSYASKIGLSLQTR